MKWLGHAWRQLITALTPDRKLIIIEGDSLPTRLPRRNLVLAREDGEDWCVGLRCPCGCGKQLEMMLLREVNPRWDLTVDERRRPTLYPSVWLRDGCRSHFWVRQGKVVWCE
jgi:Family of unknown function (DUF6527)